LPAYTSRVFDLDISLSLHPKIIVAEIGASASSQRFGCDIDQYG
jgi:hypothetical protein